MIRAIIKIILGFILIISIASTEINAITPWLVCILTLISGFYDAWIINEERNIENEENLENFRQKTKLKRIKLRSVLQIIFGLLFSIISAMATVTPNPRLPSSGDAYFLSHLSVGIGGTFVISIIVIIVGIYRLLKINNQTRKLKLQKRLNYEKQKLTENSNINLKPSDEKSIDTIEKEPIVHQTSEEKNIESAVIEPTIFQTADMKTNELNPTQKYKQKKSRNYNKLVIALLIFTTVLTLINSAILITPHIANNIPKQQYKVTFYYNEKIYFSIDNNTGVEKRRNTNSINNSVYKMATTYSYLTIPETPISDYNNFEFYGWYTEPECINRFDFNQKINRDTKLYAKWVRYY